MNIITDLNFIVPFAKGEYCYVRPKPGSITSYRPYTQWFRSRNFSYRTIIIL